MKTNGLHVVRMSQMNEMNMGKDSRPFEQLNWNIQLQPIAERKSLE
jgi:hypothetical protein